jgi:streptogramin lyase
VLFRSLDGSEGFQDGQGADARFADPHGIVPFPGIDGAFLIADQRNHVIRKVTHTGEVTTFVGDKKSGWLDGDDGLFKKPTDIIVGPDNNLVVCDKRNHALRTVSLSKEIKTLTGNSHHGTNDYNFFIDGPAEESFFFEPCAIALDRSGRILVADYYNSAVRLVDTSGKVTTIAGTGAPGHVDGPGRTAQFSRPSAIAVDDRNNIFVADEHNDSIRMITSDPTEPETYNVTTLAFPGQPFELSNPVVLAIDKRNRIYVAEYRSTASFRVISV